MIIIKINIFIIYNKLVTQCSQLKTSGTVHLTPLWPQRAHSQPKWNSTLQLSSLSFGKYTFRIFNATTLAMLVMSMTPHYLSLYASAFSWVQPLCIIKKCLRGYWYCYRRGNETWHVIVIVKKRWALERVCINGPAIGRFGS